VVGVTRGTVAVEIGIDLDPLEEAIRQASLTGGLRPFPVRLPRAERWAGEDAKHGAEEQSDQEVAAAAAARRHDGTDIHAPRVRSGA